MRFVLFLQQQGENSCKKLSFDKLKKSSPRRGGQNIIKRYKDKIN